MNYLSIEDIFPSYFIPKNQDKSEIWNKIIQFNKGEKYLIIAPSGSGKSTLATAMLGMHTEYTGLIKYENDSIRNLHLEKIVGYRKKSVNLLFQDVRLIKELTIKENILLRVFKEDKAQYQSKLTAYSKKLNIESLLDKKAMNCSYGERQRAAIVRSLINPTDFLLYDECFSHLDLDNKKIAFELINQVAEENNCAVIFFELNEFNFAHDYITLHL